MSPKKFDNCTAEEYRHFVEHGHFPEEPKPSKYGNQKVTFGDKTFDSKWEYERYLELVALEGEGKIKCLKTQVKIMLQPGFEINDKKVRAIHYVADFTYYKKLDIPSVLDVDPSKKRYWEHIVEDAKGMRTDVFNLKWKMLQFQYRDRTDVRLKLTFKGGKQNGNKS